MAEKRGRFDFTFHCRNTWRGSWISMIAAAAIYGNNISIGFSPEAEWKNNNAYLSVVSTPDLHPSSSIVTPHMRPLYDSSIKQCGEKKEKEKEKTQDQLC